jgi:hypothetical protein
VNDELKDAFTEVMFLPGAAEWLADLQECFAHQKQKADAKKSAEAFDVSSQASSSSSVRSGRRKSRAKSLAKADWKPVGTSKKAKQGPHFNEKKVRAWVYGAVDHLPLCEQTEILRLVDEVSVRTTNRAAYLLKDAYVRHQWKLDGEQKARDHPLSDEEGGSTSSQHTSVSTLGPRPRMAPSASASRQSDVLDQDSVIDPNPDVRSKASQSPVVAKQQPAVQFMNVSVTPTVGITFGDSIASSSGAIQSLSPMEIETSVTATSSAAGSLPGLVVPRAEPAACRTSGGQVGPLFSPPMGVTSVEAKVTPKGRGNGSTSTLSSTHHAQSRPEQHSAAMGVARMGRGQFLTYLKDTHLSPSHSPRQDSVEVRMDGVVADTSAPVVVVPMEETVEATDPTIEITTDATATVEDTSVYQGRPYLGPAPGHDGQDQAWFCDGYIPVQSNSVHPLGPIQLPVGTVLLVVSESPLYVEGEVRTRLPTETYITVRQPGCIFGDVNGVPALGRHRQMAQDHRRVLTGGQATLLEPMEGMRESTAFLAPPPGFGVLPPPVTVPEQFTPLNVDQTSSIPKPGASSKEAGRVSGKKVLSKSIKTKAASGSKPAAKTTIGRSEALLIPKVEVEPVTLAATTSILGAGSPVTTVANPYHGLSSSTVVERLERPAPRLTEVPAVQVPTTGVDNTLAPSSPVVDSSAQNLQLQLTLLSNDLSGDAQNVAEEDTVQDVDSDVNDAASAQSVAAASVVDDQLAQQAGQMHISPVTSDTESEIPENQGLGPVSGAQKDDASGDTVTTQSGV